MEKIPNRNSILWKYQKPVIVYYHMTSEKIRPYYPHGTINPDNFRDQIRVLKKSFDIISLPEAIEREQSNKSLENNLLITVDDGFAECYSVIAPFFVEEKVPATFFLIANCINSRNMMWQHQLQYLQQTLPVKKRNDIIQEFLNKSSNKSNLLELANQWNLNEKDKFAEQIWNLSGNESLTGWLQTQQPYLTTQQIKKLVNAGFSIGSHSATHPSCDKLNFDELHTEIVESCNSIGKEIGAEVKYFSYPFGRRAKKEFENKILESSNIECLIAGKPHLLGKTKFPFWEAYNFERKKSKLLWHLLLNSFDAR